jgi:nucleoside-diphosphate-sugar epimerase
MVTREKLLIVGCGFIGSHIAKEAIARNFEVSVISLNEKSTNEKINNVEYLVVNILDLKKLSTVISDILFDYVINLGGYINHSNYYQDGNKVFDVHFEGAKNIVNCINLTNLNSFIQIGSSDEYGGNAAPQNEFQRESPISPYSSAKVSATHFFQMMYRTEKFPVVILRPFLVYGEGQDESRFIPQIIKGCLDNKVFPVSSGIQLRDFCFIDDIVESIFISLRCKKAFGEVINVASGIPVDIKSVVEEIKKIIGLGKPQFGSIPYREGENMELYADISKANTILNWQPKISLNEGLRKTIESFKEAQN